MFGVLSPRRWLSAGIVIALAACSAPGDQADEADLVAQAEAVDLAAEAEAVENVSMQWLEAAQARDLDAVTALFASDAVLFDEGEGSIEGVPAIRADIESDWAEYPDAAIAWSTNSVEVASSGDMAWERGTWTFDPDGAGEAGEMTGEYVTIYKKVGDTWKVASDFGVTNEPADLEDADDTEM
jgi:uncharacterized protein (TIGR02246 family)